MPEIIALPEEIDRTQPHLILGYESGRRSQNVLHDLLGGGLAVTYRPARLRAGTLRLLYLTEADAAAAHELLARPTRFVLTGSDRATFDMTFLVPDSGSVTLRLDDATRATWTVDVDFQEVTE